METLLTILKRELKRLEADGRKGSAKWWEIVESITAIEQNI